jgi:hypothetical protein
MQPNTWNIMKVEQIVYKVPNVVAKSLSPSANLYHIMVIDQTKLNHHFVL